MSLPELIANSPTPGTPTSVATLAVAVSTTPAAGTVESWSFSGTLPSALRQPGQFRFVIDAEICLDTTGGSGGSRTIIRGAEGSTPTTHLAGTPIVHDLTAGALDARYVKADGTNLPSATVSDASATPIGIDSTGVTNGQGLLYDATSGKWKPVNAPQSIAAAGTVTNPVELLDATAAAFTRTLPTAVGFKAVYRLKAIASNTNIVTLQTTSAQTIDGVAPPLQLGSQASGAAWQSVDVASDGANWRIVGGIPNGAATVTTSMLAAGGFGSSAGNAIAAEYAGAVSSQTIQQYYCYYVQIDLSWPRTLTGIGYFVGGTADTTSGKIEAGIANAAGTVVAANAVNGVASVAQPGVSQVHLIPFSAPYAAAAGTYFLALGLGLSSTATAFMASATLAPAKITQQFGIIATALGGALNGGIPAGLLLPVATPNFPLMWAY